MSAPLADSLAAAPAVRAARQPLGARDDVWIVGGAVRDAALGRDVVDVDLVVAGEAGAAAREISSAVGGVAFSLSEEFGTWRALGPGWHVDITSMRGGAIEADLALRDFTINSVAVPLADPGIAPIDPRRGLADLDARILRATSDRSFGDDPLRVLRAARLASVLKLDLEPRTVELARSSADRAADPAGERQLAELRLLITGPDPIRGLELMGELDATAAVLPELEALRGVEQNPNHHLDVYGHTMEVLRRLLEVESDLDRYAGERAPEIAALLAEPLADELTRGGALRLGAVVHDIGKPATRGLHGDYITFIGHDREGARIVGGLIRRLKASRRLTRHLQDLTLHHLRLGFLARERPLPRRREYEYLRDTDPVSADVTLLTVADRLAARGQGPIAGPEMVRAHLDLAREMLASALDWRRDGPPRSPIPGDELAAELGIDPGPELGHIIGEVEGAVYAGEVSGRDDAVAFARQLMSRAEG
ncbi:MAG: HD domain-containing protein [Solirubrobacterales bacterium]